MTDFPNAHESANKELGWDSPLVKTKEFTLLSEGHYRFKVVHFEKDFYEDDSTSCPVANLRLEIDNEHGNVVINQKLFLTEGNIQMISDFFASIGMTPEEDAPPAWDEIVGKEGGCHIIQKKLDFKTINSVDKFIPRN